MSWGHNQDDTRIPNQSPKTTQPEPKVTHHEDGSRAETCTFLDPATGQRTKRTIEYYNSDGSLKHKNVDVFDINTGQITQETLEGWNPVKYKNISEYEYEPNTGQLTRKTDDSYGLDGSLEFKDIYKPEYNPDTGKKTKYA